MEKSSADTVLPGFRFHPTEDELLGFYLKNAIFGKSMHFHVIDFLNIYNHDPSELPGLAKIGEREWYFFVHRDKKSGVGGRPNRTTKNGFWKATGSDRKIFNSSGPKKVIGLKKTLVFYKGRAPYGSKTDWIMNEYRLPTSLPLPKDIVLCKIYRKATSMKVLEQRAAMEEEMSAIHSFVASSPFTPPMDAQSSSVDNQSYQQEDEFLVEQMDVQDISFYFKKEDEEYTIFEEMKNEEAVENRASTISSSSSIKLPLGIDKLPELQVPRVGVDWTQDSFWTLLRSPWLDNFSSPIANVLNY